MSSLLVDGGEGLTSLLCKSSSIPFGIVIRMRAGPFLEGISETQHFCCAVGPMREASSSGVIFADTGRDESVVLDALVAGVSCGRSN